jgi:hypothetical protein
MKSDELRRKNSHNLQNRSYFRYLQQKYSPIQIKLLTFSLKIAEEMIVKDVFLFYFIQQLKKAKVLILRFERRCGNVIVYGLHATTAATTLRPILELAVNTLNVTTLPVYKGIHITTGLSGCWGGRVLERGAEIFFPRQQSSRSC